MPQTLKERAAYMRDWVRRNPDKLAAIKKRRVEKAKLERKSWKLRNHDKVMQSHYRRRALKAQTRSEDCRAKIKLLHREPFCHWCCIRLTPKTRTIDHVVPLSRGGTHSGDNLVAACGPCNFERSEKLISEWTWKEAA